MAFYVWGFCQCVGVTRILETTLFPGLISLLFVPL